MIGNMLFSLLLIKMDIRSNECFCNFSNFEYSVQFELKFIRMTVKEIQLRCDDKQIVSDEIKCVFNLWEFIICSHQIKYYCVVVAIRLLITCFVFPLFFVRFHFIPFIITVGWAKLINYAYIFHICDFHRLNFSLDFFFFFVCTFQHFQILRNNNSFGDDFT